MCGLAGVLHAPSGVASPQLVERMATALRHRGPDDAGVLTDGPFGVAHARLSIVDPSTAGYQPMSDGRFTLAYNGEIYNHASLRPVLEARGVRFIGHSDTETLFHALRVLGVPETLRAVRGMFAFAFYEHEQQQLHLCRDRFGIKPLYYSWRSGTLAWGSEIKALRELHPCRPDPFKTILSIAGGGNNSHRYSVFEGIVHVPPGGHVSTRAGEAPKVALYFSLTSMLDAAYRRELDGMPYEEITRELARLMARSVDSMLMSDAPVGVLASGGLDSSLIAALSRRAGHSLPLYTSEVVGQYSELADAQALAAHLDVPLHTSRFAPAALLDHIVACTWHHESPLIENLSGVPFSQVCLLARDHGVKVLLSGEGADELFRGYTVQHARRFVRAAMVPFTVLERLYRRTPLLRNALAWKQRESAADFLVGLSHEFSRGIARREYVDAYADVSRRALSIELESPIAMYEHLISLLHRNDRMGMMASIEARFPFLSEDVVRFGLNLPARFKTRLVPRITEVRHPFVMTKAPIRSMLAPLVPRQLIDKKKVGFHMHTLGDARFTETFFRNGYLADAAGLHPAAIRHMLAHESRNMVGRLAAVEIFGRLFGIGQSATEIAELLHGEARMTVPMS
jgi:asparagine synthase (glutamine-hydrolysing)